MNEVIIDHEINDWKIEPSKHYTEDDLIHAYLRGKEEGMNIEKRIMFEKFQQNLKLATSEGVGLFNILGKEKINCKLCYLKAENPLCFEIIYLIDNDDYTEDNLNKVYEASRKKKKEINKETFYLNFSFIPDNGNVNEKRLIADGYVLQYSGKK